MSNPLRETKGFSFHSICIQVKDIDESVMFYQEVFGMSECPDTGMDMVREATVGYVATLMQRYQQSLATVPGQQGFAVVWSCTLPH